jgi:hypothetical protein
MKLFVGEPPSTVPDQNPVLVFETPLQGFDARTSGTTAAWSQDSRECTFTLAAHHGEATLVVTPSQNRVVFESHLPIFVRKSDPLPWILLVVTVMLCLGWKFLKRT